MYAISKFSTKAIIKFFLIILISSIYILSRHVYGSLAIFFITALLYGLHFIGDKHHLTLNFSILHFFVLFFGLFCLISGGWAINSDYAIQRGITILSMFVFVVLLYPCLKDSLTIEEMLTCYKLAGYIIVTYAIFYYGVGSITNLIVAAERLDSEFLNSNTLGMLSATSIILAVYTSRKEKPQIYDLFSVVCFLMVSISGSRKALFLMLFGCFMILFMFNEKYKFSKKLNYLFVALIGLTFVIYVSYSFNFFTNVLERFYTLFNMFTGEGQVDQSALWRIEMIKIGLAQFDRTPWIGIGMDNPRILVNAYIGQEMYLHNNYVELLAGGGIVGFCLFYIIPFYLIIHLYKLRKHKDEDYAIIFTLTSISLILDFGMVSYYSKMTYLCFLMYYIYLERLKKKEKSFYT